VVRDHPFVRDNGIRIVGKNGTSKCPWVLLFHPNQFPLAKAIFADAIDHVEGKMFLIAAIRGPAHEKVSIVREIRICTRIVLRKLFFCLNILVMFVGNDLVPLVSGSAIPPQVAPSYQGVEQIRFNPNTLSRII